MHRQRDLDRLKQQRISLDDTNIYLITSDQEDYELEQQAYFENKQREMDTLDLDDIDSERSLESIDRE